MFLEPIVYSKKGKEMRKGVFFSWFLTTTKDGRPKGGEGAGVLFNKKKKKQNKKKPVP